MWPNDPWNCPPPPIASSFGLVRICTPCDAYTPSVDSLTDKLRCILLLPDCPKKVCIFFGVHVLRMHVCFLLPPIVFCASLIITISYQLFNLLTSDRSTYVPIVSLVIVLYSSEDFLHPILSVQKMLLLDSTLGSCAFYARYRYIDKLCQI